MLTSLTPVYSLALQRCFPNSGNGYEALDLSLIFCHPLSSGNVFHSSDPDGNFPRISEWIWGLQSILSLALSQSHKFTKGADLMGANSSESVMSWSFMDEAVGHVFLPASPFSQSFFPSLVVEKHLCGKAVCLNPVIPHWLELCHQGWPKENCPGDCKHSQDCPLLCPALSKQDPKFPLSEQQKTPMSLKVALRAVSSLWALSS